MTIGIVAVQGAFIEHRNILTQLGVHTVELRKKEDLNTKIDGLILPGGESTVQGKLLKELDMFDNLKEQILNGLPVFGTCAGMILLAKKLANDRKTHFATMPITVKRNAFGRQLGSFYTLSAFDSLGEIPMTFIRAPYVESCDRDVTVLAKVQDKIVAVRYGNQLAVAFHPELNNNTQIHRYFLNMIKST